MKKYQIVEIGDNGNHAGTKAPADIVKIAENMGFENIYITMNTYNNDLFSKVLRQIGFIKSWNDAVSSIEDNSILLLQNPFRCKQLRRESVLKRLKYKKNVKFISIIHDVEELRKTFYNEYFKHEFEIMLELSDVLIVHNETMKRFFLEKGVSNEKIVVLDIFDYLQDQEYIDSIFSKSLSIAGNLDSYKSRYISQLVNVDNCIFNLFGPNFNEELAAYDNIRYHGSFPANEIPSKLTEGFGLIWDGDSIDTCTGNTGEYLKYNNPHKLSLYLSSGLPVVIWKEAAEAEYVKKNNLGFAISSLNEIGKIFDSITISEYKEMTKNVKEISEKLKHGEYTRESIRKALDILQ